MPGKGGKHVIEKADAGGDLADAAGVGLRREAVERRCVHLRLYDVVGVGGGIRADRRVVRQRRDRRDRRVAAGVRGHAVEPIAEDERVGIEQYHLRVGEEAQGAVAGLHEAEVGGVGFVGEQPLGGEALQRHGQLGIGRAVVDEVQREALLCLAVSTACTAASVSSKPR